MHMYVYCMTEHITYLVKINIHFCIGPQWRDNRNRTQPGLEHAAVHRWGDQHEDDEEEKVERDDED